MPNSSTPSSAPATSATSALSTFHQLEHWLNARRVTEVECLVPDLTGVARGKILPRSKLSSERGMRLPETIIGLTVTGNTPESHTGIGTLLDMTDPDMMLVPDPSTVRMVPWAADLTAQVIHDCYFRDGTPVDYVPRQVLRNVVALYAKQGWKPVVAPELEFYLVDKNTDPDVPLRAPVGRSGRHETSRQHYSIDAVNEFDPLFEEIYDYCDAMDLDVDTLIHEIGAGQMEINFLHGDPIDLADKVFYFKRTLREAAMRHNMYATFMAKPMEGEPGSAMHVHQSVVDARTGENIFSNPDGSPSPAFYAYIGGLQKYVPAALPFFAPYVNSYRRLVPGAAAPVNLHWGCDNRTVGLRVPESSPAARRIENRVIGADANPYVALAATLACGYLGMVQQLEASHEMTGNAYLSDEALPDSLREALQLLEECSELQSVMGRRFCGVYRAVKMTEYIEFMREITRWEREHLLLHV